MYCVWSFCSIIWILGGIPGTLIKLISSNWGLVLPSAFMFLQQLVRHHEAPQTNIAWTLSGSLTCRRNISMFNMQNMAQIAYLPIAMFDYCTWGSNTNIHTVCEGLEHQIETYVVEIGLLPSRKLTARSVPNGFSWVFHIYPPVSSNISGWEIQEIPEMEVYSCKNSRTVIPHVFFSFCMFSPIPLT